MVARFPFWRRLTLGGFVLLFAWSASIPAFAQDSAGSFSNYQNTQVSSILDIYEQLSGKQLVRDANLANVPNVSINATGLTQEEFLKLVETTLLLNGVAIVPLDSHTSKVVFFGNAKNPRSEGVKIYANAADLPATDEVVSYYMPLDYISPQEAQTIFQQTAPVHPYGAYVIAPSAQAVILTESTSVIRQLIALKELIDMPAARVTTEFIDLERADAEKVADLLNKLLSQKSDATAGAAPGASEVSVPAALGIEGPLMNEHNLLSGNTEVFPDTRSNRLIVITRPANIPFLRKMIAQLDEPDIYLLPQRRPLHYVLAQNILPALEAALAQGKDEEDQVKKDASSVTTPTASTTPAQQPQAQPQTSTTSTTGGSSVGGGSLSGITASLAAPPENDVPELVSIGKTRIVADNRSNTIIVFGSPDAVTRIFNMIDELDRRPLQVYLATVIGELTVSEGFEFGIDILQNFQRIGSGGLASSQLNTSASTTSASVPNPMTLLTSSGFPIVSGLTLYGAIGSTLNAYVRALETTNRFKVVSRPSVYTTNNKLAVIASGSQIPVPASTTSGFSGTSSDLVSTSSIQYENVLLQLNIIPLINANHEVTLKISQTNNSVGANQVISGNNVPTILTQEISTEVTVPDKSTIVIGGLISDTTKRSTSGVPLLSDIPLLGYLFKDTQKSKERDELIIMIQPTVVETYEDQIAANETEKQRTILGREAEDAANATPNPPIPVKVLAPATVHTTEVRSTIYDSKGIAVGHNTESTTTVMAPASLSAPRSSAPPTDASGPAPDVSNGQLPKDAPATPSPSQ